MRVHPKLYLLSCSDQHRLAQMERWRLQLRNLLLVAVTLRLEDGEGGVEGVVVVVDEAELDSLVLLGELARLFECFPTPSH